MQLAHRNRIVVGGASMVALALVMLAGCTMVGDHLTGVRLTDENPTTCVKGCNDSYKLLYAEEQARHLAAIESCQALSGEDRNTCLEAESVLHEANKDALTQGKLDCQNNCHRQGAGGGS